MVTWEQTNEDASQRPHTETSRWRWTSSASRRDIRSRGRDSRRTSWRQRVLGQRGTSMVETQIAIAFMGITLLALAQMMAYSHLAIAKGGSMTVDTARARQTMEAVRSAPLSVPACPAERPGVACKVELVSANEVGPKNLPNNLYRITVKTPSVMLEALRATNLDNQ